MKRLFFLFPLFFVSELEAQDTLMPIVFLDDVVISEENNGFSVEDFIRYVKQDTTFYMGFKHLRYYSHKYDSELNIFDKKGKIKGVLKKSGNYYSDGKKVENIEDLFFEFLRVAEEIKPKVIVAENVAGLMMGEAKQYYYKITNTFEKIGYDVSSMVLDSSHYGVPQTRKRVIFIAVREDVTSAIGLTFMNIAGIFPEKFSEAITCGDAFSDLEYDEEEIKMLTEKFAKGSHFETASKMPLDPDKVLTGCDYHPKGHHFNMKRISRHKPSPTITASGGCIHWSEMRKLALCESRRAMSLPDDFKLTGKWEQKSERMGRMVPPLMMKAIADAVYERVLKPYKELNNG